MVNLLDFGLAPTAALEIARFHCQIEGPVWLERRASDFLYQNLIDRDHQVEWHDQDGSGSQLIVVDQATQTLRAGVERDPMHGGRGFEKPVRADGFEAQISEDVPGQCSWVGIAGRRTG